MKRKALGRGLSALLSDMPVAEVAKASNVQEISPQEIDANHLQPREVFDGDSLQELTDSIRTYGVLQPLLVRPHPEQLGRFQLIAGERRLRASRQAAMDVVPCIILNAEEAEMLEIALVENIQRTNLSPLEEARAYQHLAERFSLTQEQIAGRVGKSRETVANTLRLLNLPDSVLKYLEDGLITVGHAKCLLSLKTPQEIEALAKRVILNQLSVRETEKLVKQKEEKPVEAVGTELNTTDADVHVQDLQRALEEAFQTKVQIHVRGKKKNKGSVEVEFFDFDHLQSLLERWNVSIG